MYSAKQPNIAECGLDDLLQMMQNDFHEFSFAEKLMPVPLSFEDKGVTIFCAHTYIGEDDQTGCQLLEAVFDCFVVQRLKIRAIVLMHKAVTLAFEGSPVYANLVILEKMGCDITVCEISAEEFAKGQELQIGHKASIKNIAEKLFSQGKVIRL
ncbi:MAG: hypothetical protein K6G50_02540 [bacterium]|nr:hypothetical protein [bacterium]